MLSESADPSAGRLIAQLLQERNLSCRLLASIIGFDETSLNRVIQDKRSCSPDLALRLESAFNVSAERFLQAQLKYDLAVARSKTQKQPDLSRKTDLIGQFPIKEMMKRGWLNLESTKHFEEVEDELLRFFKTNDLSTIQNLSLAAKKTNAHEAANALQQTWVQRARLIASEIIVKQCYSEELARQAVKKLENLMFSVHEIRKAPNILADAGIRFVIVESLKGSKMDGATFWLDDGYSPVIAMSLRFDRIDNFWFVLRHELEHVILGHGKQAPMIDIDLGSDFNQSVEEDQANAAASDFGIPLSRINSFVARKSPFFNESDIEGLARTFKVHSGIVVGKIQRATGMYQLLRKHLVPVRSIITPNAYTDGWGNPYPLEKTV